MNRAQHKYSEAPEILADEGASPIQLSKLPGRGESFCYVKNCKTECGGLQCLPQF